MRVVAALPWLTGCQLVFPRPDLEPATHNVAFVTSEEFVGKELGGLVGADQRCQEAAAGLPANTYIAWLSDPTTDAVSRLEGARGWVRPDGEPVADEFTELAMRGPRVPLVVTEQLDDVRGFAEVWTGTDSQGQKHPSTCVGWTGDGLGLIGDPSLALSAFTTFDARGCDQARRLYCLGIDLAEPLAPSEPHGPLLFTSTAKWPLGDPAEADALCQSEATTASVPGTFQALLTRQGSAPRLPPQTDFYRVDGVRIGPILAGERPNTFPVLSASNVTLDTTDHDVWTGGFKVGTPATTCNDWSPQSANDTGSLGFLNESKTGMLVAGELPCDHAAHVYCVQSD